MIRLRPSAAFSLFYASSFALLGVYLPYFNLYLDRLGLSAAQIGAISAILPLCGALVPAAGGWLADRLGRRRDVVLIASSAALCAFLPMFAVTRFRWVAAVMALYALCRAPALPIVEASALELAGRGGTHYGRMRAWGSFAFIVAALLAAPVVGRWGDGAVLPAMTILLAGGVFAALAMPPDPGRGPRRAVTLRAAEVLKRRDVIVFLVACVLSQASHGPYYVFFSLHLRGAGVPTFTLGMLWATAIACEIVMMLRMPGVLARLGTTRTITVCLFLAAIRWTLCSLTVDPGVLAIAQALHAATFAAFHVAAVTHTFEVFGRDRSATGQAIYSSATYGLGNIVGMVGSGLLRDRLGTPSLFAIGAVAAMAGAVLMLPLALRRRPLPA
jgi:PPP family 3-phenylpropionic acid transporter